MRILLTVHQFLPEHSSGTEILTLHTALELKARGHEVRVLTAIPAAAGIPDDERFDCYELDGIPVARFRHAHSAMGDQNNVAEQEYDNHLVARYFTGLVEEFRPDVLHFFHLARLSASIVEVCLQKGIPTVLTPTDFWFVCPTCQLRLPDGTMCPGPDSIGANCVSHLAGLKLPQFAPVIERLPKAAAQAMVRFASLPPFRRLGPARLVSALSRRQDVLKDRLNRIDKVLAPTRLMQRTLQAYGLDPSHVGYCAYGIRLPRTIAREPHAQGPLRMGVIGLGEHKGAHILVQAVRKLSGLDLALRIYGRPADCPEYAQRLEQLAGGDPRVEFCGGFANDEIGVILSQLDVLVVPSLWFENAPLVVYSAQAAGVPVIASDVAGIAELVTDGDNGRLFPAGDAEALARILARLAANPGQIAALAARARKPKTIAAYADELLAVYAGLGADRRQET